MQFAPKATLDKNKRLDSIYTNNPVAQHVEHINQISDHLTEREVIEHFNKYKSDVLRFGFLDSFKANIIDTPSQRQLREMRDRVIVNRDKEFKIWLNQIVCTNSEKQEYKQAYNRQYYKQRIISDSIIHTFK